MWSSAAKLNVSESNDLNFNVIPFSEHQKNNLIKSEHREPTTLWRKWDADEEKKYH